MATAWLTRVVSFTARHRYWRPEWSAERNASTFGPTVRDHQHVYQCAVTVRGTPDPVTGMVIDLGALDQILREEVVARFDHRSINDDVPEFADGKTVPTGEMLCVYIWTRIVARLPSGCALDAVRVQEDPTLFAEYRGA